MCLSAPLETLARPLSITPLRARALAPLAYRTLTVLKPRTVLRRPMTIPRPDSPIVLCVSAEAITTGNTLGAKFIVIESVNSVVLY